MRPGIMTVALLQFALPLLTQELPPRREQRDQRGQETSIAGLVVAARSSEPLKKARLTLTKAEAGGRLYIAITDPSGRFVLKDIEPGRYHLRAQHIGFVEQEYGQKSPEGPGAILTLESGQRLSDLIFRLVPSAVISGRVFGEDGEALPWVYVQALRYSYLEGRRHLSTAGQAPTNDLGEYRLFGLPPGRYYISATYSPGLTILSPRGYSRTWEPETDESYAPTYYPGANDPGSAIPVDVHPGEEVPIGDFVLQPTRTVRIRGRVFNSISGRPGRGASIDLMPRGSDVLVYVPRNTIFVEDAQGAFEIRGVTPGSYTVAADWFYGGKMYSAQQPVEVANTDVEGLNLVLALGVDLSGRVRVEGKAGIQLADLQVSLSPVEFGYPVSSSVRPDGTFVLQNVPEGTYRVYVWHTPPGVYMKAARLGDSDVLEADLTVNRGHASGELELVLSTRSGQVEGTVLDADDLPVSGVIVAMIPEKSRRKQSRLYKSTTTDQFGRFILPNATPGEYKLFAWEKVEEGAWEDSDFLRPFEDRGQTVSIGEGGHGTVELKLIPTDKKTQ